MDQVKRGKSIHIERLTSNLRALEARVNNILARWNESSAEIFLEKARTGIYANAEDDAVELRMLLLEQKKYQKLIDRLNKHFSNLHSDKVIRSTEVVIDEKTRYTELKKLVLSSPDCFKVFRYLSLQMDDKSPKEIGEGTKLGLRIVSHALRDLKRLKRLIDSNEIKDMTSKVFNIPGTHYYYIVKNKLVNELREEISLISPEKYLDEYFTSRDEQHRKSIVSTQEGLEKLLVEFNDNTLSVKDFLRRAATTANCSELVVIDEVLTFIYSTTLRRVVKSYDKEVEQPREIRDVMVLSSPEFEILNEGKGIECYARCNMSNEEVIPLHFYGAIANRLSKGKLEKFFSEDEMRKDRKIPSRTIKHVKDIKRKDVKRSISTNMIVRGRMIGGVFFVFAFQDRRLGEVNQWDVEKRYFHRDCSYAFQRALDNVSRKFCNKTEKALLLLEEEAIAKMKSISIAYLESNEIKKN